MKLVTLVFVFLIIPFVGFGQRSNIDSLLQVSEENKLPLERAAAYQRLAWLHILKDVKKAVVFNDSAHYIYSKNNDELGIAQTYYKYGVIYRFTGEYKKAHENLDKYKIFCAEKKDTFSLANVAYQKGVVYSLQGDYEKSLLEYFNTLSIYESLKDTSSVGFTLNSIGLVQKNLKQYDNAIKSFRKAEEIHLEKENLRDLADTYGNISQIYALRKEYEVAIDYQQKALAIDLEIDNSYGSSVAFQHLGTIYLETNEYALALSNFEKARELQIENHYSNELAQTYLNIGNLHTIRSNEVLAEKAWLNGLRISEEAKEVQIMLHGSLQLLYEKNNRLQESLFHEKRKNQLKDSILNQENLRAINLLQQQYESEKKDKEIASKELLLLEQTKLIDRRNLYFKLLVGGAIGLLLLFVISWMVYKKNQKAKEQEIIALKRKSEIETLESLIEGEEKERFRIAKELHDGVNGDLSAIKFKLNSMMESNNKELSEAVAMIDKSCDQVRAISHNLVPPALENFDLRTATSDYCYKVNSNYSQEIIFQYLGESLSLSKSVEINIYRIIQELVTNSLKHAEANEIHVQLSSSDELIQVTVEDNGVGFDVSRRSNGIGLRNIKSRVDYLGGELDILSNSEGTSVSVLINRDKHD